MKKLFAILLSLAMILSIAACGSKTETPDANPDPAPTSETDTTPEPTPDPAPVTPDWPKKTVNFVVGFAAGGDTDLYARTVAKYMEKKLGQTFIVTNTTGASGANACLEVAESAPDGYTFLWNHDGCLVNEACGNLAVSFLDDVQIGCRVLTDNSYTIVANKNTGIHNYDELIAYAKANPETLTINVNANSNGLDIIRKFELAADISLKHIEGPSSASERIAACLGDQIDLVYANYSLLADYVQNGDFYIIGSLGEEPCAAHPEVPCLSDLTGNEIVSPYIFGFRYPKGVDPDIITYFESVVEEITQDPEFVAEVAALGGNIDFANGADHEAFQRAEIDAIRARLGV